MLKAAVRVIKCTLCLYLYIMIGSLGWIKTRRHRNVCAKLFSPVGAGELDSGPQGRDAGQSSSPSTPMPRTMLSSIDEAKFALKDLGENWFLLFLSWLCILGM